MKIEGFIYPETILKANNESGSVSLEEGQVLSAKVLSCENGNAILKTEAGYILRAKLDAGIILEQGSVLTLVAGGQRDGVFLLKLISESPDNLPVFKEPEELAAPVEIPKEIPEAVVRLLDKLDITITKEVIGQIVDLVKQNSDLSPEKIVFFAVNKLDIREADSLFIKENGTARQLGQLLRLADPDVSSLSNTEEPSEYAFFKPEGLNRTGGEIRVVPDGGDMVTELIKDLSISQAARGLTGKPSAAESEIPAHINASANIVAEDGSEKIPLPRSDADIIELMTDISHYEDAETETAAITLDSAAVGAEINTAEDNTVSFPSGFAPAAAGIDSGESGTNLRNTDIELQPYEEAQKALTTLLTRMPAFQSRLYEKVTPKTVAEMAEIIIEAFAKVQELKGPGPDKQEKLKKYLNDLFVKLTGDTYDGARLKKARDELYTKLLILKENLPSMELSGKTELIEQTQKLLEHIKTCNDINQFVYTQIPIVLSGEHRTAELFFFKKKKGMRKIDPENVKILLALDLINLGHFEGLVSIKGKDVSLRIEVSKNEAETVFLQNTIKLHKMLAEIGFKLVGISVKKPDKEIPAENALFALLEEEKLIRQSLDLTV